MSKFKDAKVGDKVYCLINGEGKITNIDEDLMVYPICIKFKTHGYFYNFSYNGHSNKRHVNPTLYWEKPEIIENKRVRSVIKYRVAYIFGKNFHISEGYYSNQKRFEEAVQSDCKFMQFLESTAKEFEEEV